MSRSKSNKTIDYKNGDAYTGQIDDDERPHGKGTYIFNNEPDQIQQGNYVGQWKDGEKHGQGKHQYRNGDVYDGPWENGRRHGHNGKYTYYQRTSDQSSEYIGDWKEDKKHGKGTMLFTNGDKYEGDWCDNNMHSKKATYTYADTSTNVGAWENDNKHGEGVFTYANSDVYRDEFKAGERDGKGEYRYNKGGTTKEIYANDKRVEYKTVHGKQTVTRTSNQCDQPNDNMSNDDDSDQ